MDNDSKLVRNNDVNDNVEMIIRILEIGLIFGFLKTIAIKQLLTSNRALLNFRGMFNVNIMYSD